MESIRMLLDFILHIDQSLVEWVNNYQGWTYLLLFAIIFAETGLVFMPFLPGDSVLFAMGAILAKSETSLSFLPMGIVLCLAAILGDFVNFELAKLLGNRIFTAHSKIFKPIYLQKTAGFYTKYGVKTIIYARFVPIVRTFAPFIAGLAGMPYRKFAVFNMLGGVLWVFLFMSTGFCFGSIPFIRDHFSGVILLIIVLSLLPALVQVFKSNTKRKNSIR